MRANRWQKWLLGAVSATVLWLLLLAIRPAAAAEGEGPQHTVQAGETLRRIAERYGVTVEALAAANRLVNPNLIFAGQVLTIPDNTLQEEDDISSAIEEGDGRSGETLVHVVRPGETVTRIAAAYGVTTISILQLNQLANPNLIFAGQRLQIAGAATGLVAEPAQTATTKRITVDRSDQRAYVYEGNELLWTFVVSTGMPGSETWDGTFAVRSKIPNAYAQLWGLQMPYWLGFYHTGYLENGFHALPIMPSGAILWDGYLGTPVSYGCVILSYEDAETLYQWAEIGTEVVVRP